jgi:hypothetical protein
MEPSSGDTSTNLILLNYAFYMDSYIVFIIMCYNNLKKYSVLLSHAQQDAVLKEGFGLVIRFIEHLQNITTNNCDSFTELHIPKITVTAAHIKYSQSSLAIAW